MITNSHHGSEIAQQNRQHGTPPCLHPPSTTDGLRGAEVVLMPGHTEDWPAPRSFDPGSAPPELADWLKLGGSTKEAPCT
jgi:hypothetical protein